MIRLLFRKICRLIGLCKKRDDTPTGQPPRGQDPTNDDILGKRPPGRK